MQQDHSDVQVIGIDRYIPTATTKALVASLVLAPLSLFAFFHVQMGGLVPTTPQYSKILLSLSASIFGMLLVALLLILNLMVIVYQKKHGRIYHYTNHAPEMNRKWLMQNATAKHYIFLSAVFFAGLVSGVIIKNIL